MASYQVQGHLQDDINAIPVWSSSSQLNFNLGKSVHLSFKSKIATSYNTSDTSILWPNAHKDQGLILSEDLSWNNYYSFIAARAYKVLGLIHHILSVLLQWSNFMYL